MFIARQPIFTSNLEVYGYELLFRSNNKIDRFENISSLRATTSVIINTIENGISQIVGNKKAFINFDSNFIKDISTELLDKEQMVIELLEDIEIDKELISRINELKRQGYKFALDDFEEDIKKYPLVKYADIIKYDILVTPLDKIKESVEIALKANKTLLAEKIETKEEFIKAKEMGFHLFQGYFFSKPKIVPNLNTKNNSKIQYEKILDELNRTKPSYQVMAEIIEKDVKLSYRLMRVISSKVEENEVYSIKRALMYMGVNEIERWISIMMLQDIGEIKPKELIILSLIRSKFAEYISEASKLKNRRFEGSMLGLFSTIDALLDMPMEEALKGIAIPISIKDALVRKKGELYPLYILILSYERGSWNKVENIADELKLDEEYITNAYLKAVEWATDLVDLMD